MAATAVQVPLGILEWEVLEVVAVLYSRLGTLIL
jgi:hypothetical protein